MINYNNGSQEYIYWKATEDKAFRKTDFWWKQPWAILDFGIMSPIEQICEAININEHYIEKWILLYEMERETNIQSYEWALCITKNHKGLNQKSLSSINNTVGISVQMPWSSNITSQVSGISQCNMKCCSVFTESELWFKMEITESDYLESNSSGSLRFFCRQKAVQNVPLYELCDRALCVRNRPASFYCMFCKKLYWEDFLSPSNFPLVSSRG